MTLSKNAMNELARKNYISPELLERASSSEMSGDADRSDILRVPFRIGITLNRSMAHASLFFRELRDNGVFFGAKCPECGHTLFPPIRPVCLNCIKKGELVEYAPIELGTEVEGIVEAVSKLVRGTSKDVGKGNQFPCLVRVDGADNAHWQLVLPDADKEPEVGARVRSSLKPQEERTGEVGDYIFRLV